MNLRRAIVGFVAVAVALSCTFVAQKHMDAIRQEKFDDELLYLPNERLLNHFTGGLSSLVADMLWLKCIQYTSKHFKSDRKFTWLDNMCGTITRLDPYFADVYRYGGVFLAALKADNDASIKLLKSGIPKNPKHWELPYEIAMVYLLNRRDEPDSPERAAEYVAMAVATGEAPEMVLNVARGLQMKHNLFDIEEAMWKDLLTNSKDDIMRDMAERKLQELDIRKICVMLNKAVEVYTQQFGKRPAKLDGLAAAGLMTGQPPDTLGGSYFIDADGVVQNTTLLDGLVEQRLNRIQLAIGQFEKEYGRWPKTLGELVTVELLRKIPTHPYREGSWRYEPGTGEVSSSAPTGKAQP
jgi:hypothetical protein